MLLNEACRHWGQCLICLVTFSSPRDLRKPEGIPSSAPTTTRSAAGWVRSRDKLHGRAVDRRPVVEMAPPSMLDSVVNGRATVRPGKAGLKGMGCDNHEIRKNRPTGANPVWIWHRHLGQDCTRHQAEVRPCDSSLRQAASLLPEVECCPWPAISHAPARRRTASRTGRTLILKWTA